MAVLRWSFATAIVFLMLPSGASAETTKADVMAAYERTLKRLPADQAAELEGMLPQLEAALEIDIPGARVTGSRGLSASGVAQASSAQSSQTFETGNLTIGHTGPPSCPLRPWVFVKGEQIHLTGAGFSSNSNVKVVLGSGDFEHNFGEFTTDATGNLDITVTVPTGDTVAYPSQTAGIVEAVGPTSSGFLTSDAMIGIASPTGDSDGDGVPDYCDNCVDIPNAGQEDQDSDGAGDLCDDCDNGADSDADGTCDDVDTCPFSATGDTDGDGVCDNEDNCPIDINPDQFDSDQNGVGNDCQVEHSCRDGLDNDGDGLIDLAAVNPVNPDPGCVSQQDTNETEVFYECDDGKDNDGDGYTDFRPDGFSGDIGCNLPTSPTENPECDDGIDNDGDGRIDWDGNFHLAVTDYQCGGLPHHNSESTQVPEPTLATGFLAGVVGLTTISRFRSRI